MVLLQVGSKSQRGVGVTSPLVPFYGKEINQFQRGFPYVYKDLPTGGILLSVKRESNGDCIKKALLKKLTSGCINKAHKN